MGISWLEGRYIYIETAQDISRQDPVDSIPFTMRDVLSLMA